MTTDRPSSRKHHIPAERLLKTLSIPVRNGRLRALMDKVLYPPNVPDLRDWLWIPPSKPTYGKPLGGTKSLIFSDWQVVPDALSCMLSHDANRHMRATRRDIDKATKSEIRAEQFEALLFPSSGLAQILAGQRFEDRNHCKTALRKQLEDFVRNKGGRIRRFKKPMRAKNIAQQFEWLATETSGEMITNGVNKSDLDLLADLVLGSPAICALSALSLEFPACDTSILQEAAHKIAKSFRSYFNQGENRILVDRYHQQGPAWKRILRYCADHDLAAVLEEYIHLITEGLGAQKASPDQVATHFQDVLTMRPSRIRVRHWGKSHSGRSEFNARFAVRFTEKADTEVGAQRTGIVQQAFKSPFRPFVLATTSVGQEGLDFHCYCSRVVHWNLPRNPVDIEQREGRVHRYKNHAVRQNIALDHLADAPDSTCSWNELFEHQDKQERAEKGRDLVPFWIYVGRSSERRKIQRCLLSLPFSREIRRYEALKKDLANYRLAFGQPRQNELMNLLSQNMTIEHRELAELMIDLQPK
jgi:hypothetical protein